MLARGSAPELASSFEDEATRRGDPSELESLLRAADRDRVAEEEAEEAAYEVAVEPEFAPVPMSRARLRTRRAPTEEVPVVAPVHDPVVYAPPVPCDADDADSGVVIVPAPSSRAAAAPARRRRGLGLRLAWVAFTIVAGVGVAYALWGDPALVDSIVSAARTAL